MNIHFFMDHWFSIAAGLFLLFMVLHGHHRGFLKTAVSIVALVLTLAVVKLAMPYMSDLIRQHTPVPQMIERGILKAAGMEDTEEVPRQEELPSQQRQAIEKLHLPEQMKEALIVNNNQEVYRLLGVEAFIDYVGAYLSNMVINAIGAVLLFILVYIGIRLLMKWMDLLAHLPVLSGINQIAGALLGGAEGLLLIWLFFLVVTACSEMDWGSAVASQIAKSPWLLFLYQNNIFNKLIMGILNHLV